MCHVAEPPLQSGGAGSPAHEERFDLMTLALAVAVTSLAAGETRPLDSCVPRDAMAVYFGRPSPEMISAPPGGAVEQLSGWIITLKAMGVIPQSGRVLADIVGSLPLLSRRPHAFM